jgi:hypothetical protein
MVGLMETFAGGSPGDSDDSGRTGIFDQRFQGQRMFSNKFQSVVQMPR